VPVTDEQGRQLVDGGLVAIVPTSVARSLGADIVIAVDVNREGATFIGPTSSVIGVLLQSILLVQKTASSYQLQMSDLVISPKVGHIRWDEMGRVFRACVKSSMKRLRRSRNGTSSGVAKNLSPNAR
jgi:NTE family protein